MAELLEAVEPVKLGAGGSASADPRRRIVLCLGLGAAAIYLATWTGPVTFYLSFQKPLLALEEGPTHGILWLAARPSSDPPAPGPAPGWTAREVKGVKIPLPPGRLVEWKGERNVFRARLAPGEAGADVQEITLALYPAGFLASLYREKLDFLGVQGEGSLDDAVVLGELSRENLERYCFGWSEAERQRYAARLLCKMTLFDGGPVTRCEVASRGSSSAVLVEQATGEAKVVCAGPGGVLVVVIPAKAPAAWKASPASWLW